MNRSLSMILPIGGNIISISEFYGKNQKEKYLLLVTSPDTTDTHIRIELNRDNVDTLIDILQEIVKEDGNNNE